MSVYGLGANDHDDDLANCVVCGQPRPVEFLIEGVCTDCRIKSRQRETRVIEDISYILRHYALEDDGDEQ